LRDEQQYIVITGREGQQIEKNELGVKFGQVCSVITSTFLLFTLVMPWVVMLNQRKTLSMLDFVFFFLRLEDLPQLLQYLIEEVGLMDFLSFTYPTTMIIIFAGFTGIFGAITKKYQMVWIGGLMGFAGLVYYYFAAFNMFMIITLSDYFTGDNTEACGIAGINCLPIVFWIIPIISILMFFSGLLIKYPVKDIQIPYKQDFQNLYIQANRIALKLRKISTHGYVTGFLLALLALFLPWLNYELFDEKHDLFTIIEHFGSLQIFLIIFLVTFSLGILFLMSSGIFLALNKRFTISHDHKQFTFPNRMIITVGGIFGFISVLSAFIHFSEINQTIEWVTSWTVNEIGVGFIILVLISLFIFIPGLLFAKKVITTQERIIGILAALVSIGFVIVIFLPWVIVTQASPMNPDINRRIALSLLDSIYINQALANSLLPSLALLSVSGGVIIIILSGIFILKKFEDFEVNSHSNRIVEHSTLIGALFCLIAPLLTIVHSLECTSFLYGDFNIDIGAILALTSSLTLIIIILIVQRVSLIRFDNAKAQMYFRIVTIIMGGIIGLTMFLPWFYGGIYDIRVDLFNSIDYLDEALMIPLRYPSSMIPQFTLFLLAFSLLLTSFTFIQLILMNRPKLNRYVILKPMNIHQLGFVGGIACLLSSLSIILLTNNSNLSSYGLKPDLAVFVTFFAALVIIISSLVNLSNDIQEPEKQATIPKENSLH